MNPSDSTARIAEMQTRGLENALAFGRAATGVFERLARQNYAVMGDVVDYTLAQMRIPTQHADPRAALEAQAAGTRGLAEKARARADEYVALAGEMRELVGGAMGASARVARRAAPAPTAPAAPRPAPVASAAKAPVAKPASKPIVSRAAPKSAEPEPAGGTPIIVPGDSPKAAARKTAEAVAPAAKTAAKKRAAKPAPAAKTPRAAAGRPAKKTAARAAKG